MTADQTVERAANKLQRLANQLAGEGGLKAKLAQPLAEDADLIRKLLELGRCAVDFLIGCHFLVGGSSPVSVRQIRADARRDTIVARAAKTP